MTMVISSFCVYCRLTSTDSVQSTVWNSVLVINEACVLIPIHWLRSWGSERLSTATKCWELDSGLSDATRSTSPHCTSSDFFFWIFDTPSVTRSCIQDVIFVKENLNIRVFSPCWFLRQLLPSGTTKQEEGEEYRGDLWCMIVMIYDPYICIYDYICYIKH